MGMKGPSPSTAGGRRGARAGGRRRVRDGLTMALAIIITIVVCGGAGAAIAALLVTTTDRVTASTPQPSDTSSATPTPVVTTSQTPPPPAPPAPPPPPVSPAEATCPNPTTMSVWAHYDDDLLFMNPALQDAISAGECVRTVFLTGADAGRGDAYAKGRELGILRAYNTMRGQEGLWSEKKVTLLTGMVASQWSPDGNPNITVTFLRLPDGNLNAAGFPATGNVSLPQLLDGTISSLKPIDGGGPAVSLDVLISSVGELIGAYHANRLFTHVPREATEWSNGDHPDHSATGSVTRAAWQRIGYSPDQVNYAIGYPTLDLGVNLGGDVLTRKVEAFRVYAAQDSVVSCATESACLAKGKFGQWLQRHYVKTERELFPND
jgi:LmbE family N-acetylglucosaminyl deacetylase